MQIEIKKLFKEVSVYKKALFIVGLAGIVNAITKGQISIFIKEVMDASSSPERLKEISKWGLLLAVSMAVSRYFHIYMMNVIAEKVAQDLRHKLQQKFMRLSLKFHNTYAAGSGGLISRILNDIRVIQDGLRMFADLFSAPLVFIFLLYNLFFLDWQLTLWILIVVPFLFVFLRKISKSLRKYVQSGQEQLETITSTIKESLDGVRTIQGFNLEQTMSQRLRSQADEYISARKKVHSRVEMMGPVTEFVATLIVLSIIYYFSLQISKNLATAGTLIAFITAMLQINEPIKKFQESYVRIQETIVAASRIYSILEEDSEVPEVSQPRAFPENWQKIEYKNVCFAYDKILILDHFNLVIHRGEFIALVGESGSGKSTVINLLARFYDPLSGEITIDGVNIKEFALKDLRAHLALVSQDVFLFSDTIEANIASGDFSKSREVIPKIAQAANAKSFIEKMSLGFKSPTGERGNLLSGGEKQRISIARAMFKDAPILILDEATSALDSASEVEVQKGLDQLMQGRTSLVIAHRLSTIQKANKILVLDKGRVVQQGTHEELQQSPGAYKRFLNLQQAHSLA